MKISEVMGDTSAEDASLKSLDAREREGERRQQAVTRSAHIGQHRCVKYLIYQKLIFNSLIFLGQIITTVPKM